MSIYESYLVTNLPKHSVSWLSRLLLYPCFYHTRMVHTYIGDDRSRDVLNLTSSAVVNDFLNQQKVIGIFEDLFIFLRYKKQIANDEKFKGNSPRFSLFVDLIITMSY